MKNLLAILSVGLMSSLTLSSVQASVTVLSGGGVGEGFSPLPVTTYAYDVYGSDASATPANQTMQGVVFLPFDVTSPPGGFTVTGTDGVNYGDENETPFDIGATADDDALENLGATSTHYASGAVSYTLGGLVAGKVYQVDLFVFNSSSNSYGEKFTVNGGTPDTFADNPNIYYDVRESVAADGLGQIVVAFSGATGTGADFDQFGRFNAFAVTTLPEPASALLLGVGGLLLGRRHRRSARA